MTVVVVPATLPRPGLVLPRLAATSPLSEKDAADLYAAMFKDVVRAVDASGGDVLVNYRASEDIPDQYDTDPKAELRALAADAVDDVGDVRFEVQVGSDRAARVGNTITHLLDEEAVTSTAVVSPAAPLLARTHVDGAAMKLRTNEVVLGPASGGRVYFAGFTETIDFTNAYQTPAVETLSARAADAGHATEFLESLPMIETGEDLCTLCSLIRSRITAERVVPQYTATAIDTLDLYVVEKEGEAVLTRS